MKNLTPLRIYILVILILVIIINLIYTNPNPYVFVDLSELLLISLIPAVIVEVLLTIFRKKISKFIYIFISLTCIPAFFYIEDEFHKWKNNVKDVIIIPDNYTKDYLIIRYNKSGYDKIKPNFEFNRKRVVTFPDSGIVYTSTKVESSEDFLNRPKAYYLSGKEVSNWIETRTFDQYEIIYLTE